MKTCIKESDRIVSCQLANTVIGDVTFGQEK